MLSFYGGRSGQSFSIKKIFNSYTEMIEDLKNANSLIEVDEYVAIFYGEPGTNDYEENLAKDTKNNYKNRNASFWQKVYKVLETDESIDDYALIDNSNIRYHLLGYFPASHPNVTVGDITAIAPANEPLVKKSDKSTPDHCIFDFDLPRAAKVWNSIPYDKIIWGGSTLETATIILEKTLTRNELTQGYSYRIGDFYLNENLSNLLCLIIKINPGTMINPKRRITLTPVTQLNVPFYEKVETALLDTTYKEAGSVQKVNDGIVTIIKDTLQGIEGYNIATLQMSLPPIPQLKATVKLNSNSSDKTTSVTSKVLDDKKTLQFDFSIPQPEKGDVGPQGPVGEPLKIIGTIFTSGDASHANDVITASLNIKYNIANLEANEVIGVNFNSDTDSPLSFWYYTTDKATWSYVYASSSGSSMKLSWQEL